jgi:hypothetical protein
MQLKAGAKGLAQQCLTVYEALCTRPPGWAATIGFFILHVGGLAMAVVLAVLVVIAQTGPLSQFARDAARQPKYAISPAEIVTSPGGEASPDAAGVMHHSIVANFKTATAARSAFEQLRPTVAPGQMLERFGQTLLFSFPAADDAARRRWIGDIEALTSDFTVSGGVGGGVGRGVMFRLTCIAPTSTAADSLEQEAQEYFEIPRDLHIVPPWSPLRASSPDDVSRYHLARRTYLRVREAESGGYNDPRVQELQKQWAAAYRHGDEAETKRLSADRVKLMDEIHQKSIQDLRGLNDGSIDPVIIDRYLALPKPTTRPDLDEETLSETDIFGFDKPQYQELAARMGQLPMSGGKPVAAADRLSSRTGHVHHAGLLMTFNWLNFNEPAYGAPAFIRWLDERGCRTMKYEFLTGAAGDGVFDSGE